MNAFHPIDARPSPTTSEAGTSGGPRIVIVDDDPDLRDLLAGYLVDHGLDAEAVDGGAALRTSLRERPCDLVILDMMMPHEDGLSILRALTDAGDMPGVIMFSALESEVDRVVALELGADDYIIKPTNPREILARVRSVLRRRRPPARAETWPAERSAALDDVFTFAGWTLNGRMRTLEAPDGAAVRLTDVEFRLLNGFVGHPQKVQAREEMIAHSDKNDGTSHRTIDVNISRLRRKLAEHDDTEIIRTVRGNGYLFLPAVSSS